MKAALNALSGCFILGLSVGTLLWLWQRGGFGFLQTGSPFAFWVAFLFSGTIGWSQILMALAQGLVPDGWFQRAGWWVLALLLAVSLAGGTLEALCGVLVGRSLKANYSGSFTRGFWQRDPVFGTRPPPNCTVDCTKTARNGDTIFQVKYATDALARRITPEAHPGEARDAFLAFFGCSMVFGDGLENNQTLPFCTESLLKGVRAYNYGFSGWGPQQMLKLLESPEFPTGLAEPHGTALYVFIDPHLDRLTGNSFVIANWGMGFPYFRLDQGKLVQNENFATGRPDLSYWYYQFADLNSSRFFQLALPLWYGAEDFQLLVETLSEGEKRFKERYVRGNFLTVFLPGSRYAERLGKALQSKGGQVLDLHALRYEPAAEYLNHPEDGHLTLKANHWLAEHLVKGLREKACFSPDHFPASDP